MKKSIILLSLISISLIYGCSPDETTSFNVDDFLSENWIHSNDGQGVDSVVIVDNEKVFCMTRLSSSTTIANLAYLNDFEFTNGIIECELHSPVEKGTLSFLGILFRALDSMQYECVYFRPFMSGKMGAIQYMPIIEDGIVNWYDYTDEVYQTNSVIPEQNWFHVKLEIVDSILTVFIDKSKEPQMTINKLELGIKIGSVGFWLGNSDKAYYKNLTITRFNNP